MNKPKIVVNSRIALNLAEVKCIRIISTSELDIKKFLLVFEFKARCSYIFNPESEKYERQEYNEKTEIEFSDFEMAQQYQLEWIDIWQEYLEEQVSADT
jgi:hypothetical protein